MWGDDPEDYQRFEMDDNGFRRIALPSEADLLCGCGVNLEWVFTNASEYAEGCIATGLSPCNSHGWALQSLDVEEKAKALAHELFWRYRRNCVPANAMNGWVQWATERKL